MKTGNGGEKQSEDERLWHKSARRIEPKIWGYRIAQVIDSKEHTMEAIRAACCIIRWDMFGEMTAKTCPDVLKNFTDTFSFVATPSDASISLVLQAVGYPQSIADKRTISEKIPNRKRDGDEEKLYDISPQDEAAISRTDMDL